MKKEEMIELLVEDRINEWVHARCHEGLEDILYSGWRGYNNYTDQELNEAFEELLEENFDEEIVEKIRVEKFRIKQHAKK